MNASQLQARMEEILELPSSTRIAEAGKLGRDHSSDANLVKLITPLLNHEPPVVPDLTTDDGLSEIIPPQKRNVAKHFDSHWTALVLAAASNSAEAVALLVEELKSPSSMFQNFVARHLIKHAQFSDEFILSLLQHLTPQKRKIVLLNCIRAHRTSVLDQFVPLARKLGGLQLLCFFVHACTSEVLAAQLEDADVANSRHVQWKYICRYHSSVVLARIRKDLEATSWNDTERIWNEWATLLVKWSSVTEFLYNGRATLPLLQLWQQFPIFEFVSPMRHDLDPRLTDYVRGNVQFSLEETRSVYAQHFTLKLPSLLQCNLKHVVQACSQEYADMLCSVMKVFENGCIGGISTVSALLEFLQNSHVRYTLKIQVLDQLFSLAVPYSAFRPPALSWDNLVLVTPTLVDGISPTHRLEFMEYMLFQLTKLQPAGRASNSTALEKANRGRTHDLGYQPHYFNSNRAGYTFHVEVVNSDLVYRVQCQSQVFLDAEYSNRQLSILTSSCSIEGMPHRALHQAWRTITLNLIVPWVRVLVREHPTSLYQGLHQRFMQLLPLLTTDEERQAQLRMFTTYNDLLNQCVEALTHINPNNNYPAAAAGLAVLASHVAEHIQPIDSEFMSSITSHWLDAIQGNVPAPVARITSNPKTVNGRAILWSGHGLAHTLRQRLVALHDSIAAFDATAIPFYSAYFDAIRSGYIQIETLQKFSQSRQLVESLPAIQETMQAMSVFLATRELPAVISLPVTESFMYGEYVWTRGPMDPELPAIDNYLLNRLSFKDDKAMVVELSGHSLLEHIKATSHFPSRVTFVTIVETAMSYQMQVETINFNQSSRKNTSHSVLPCAVAKLTLQDYITKYTRSTTRPYEVAVEVIVSALNQLGSYLQGQLIQASVGFSVHPDWYRSVAYFANIQEALVKIYPSMIEHLFEFCRAIEPISSQMATNLLVEHILTNTATTVNYWRSFKVNSSFHVQSALELQNYQAQVFERCLQHLQSTARSPTSIQKIQSALQTQLRGMISQFWARSTLLAEKSTSTDELAWVTVVEQVLRVSAQLITATRATAEGLDLAIAEANSILTCIDAYELPQEQLSGPSDFELNADDQVLAAMIHDLHRIFLAYAHAPVTPVVVLLRGWQSIEAKISEQSSLSIGIKKKLSQLHDTLLTLRDSLANRLTTFICSSIEELRNPNYHSHVAFSAGLHHLLLDGFVPLWQSFMQRHALRTNEMVPQEKRVLYALQELANTEIVRYKPTTTTSSSVADFDYWAVLNKHRSANDIPANAAVMIRDVAAHQLIESLLTSAWELMLPRLSVLPFLAPADLTLVHKFYCFPVVAYLPSHLFKEAFAAYCQNAADRLSARQPVTIEFLRDLSIQRCQARSQADISVADDIREPIAIVLEGTITADRVDDVVVILALGSHVDRPAVLRMVAYPQLLEHLAKTAPAKLGTVLATALDFSNVRHDVVAAQFASVRQIATEMLLHVLDPQKTLVDLQSRELLLQHLDLSNSASRKLLTKLSDSNSVSERIAGLRILLQATMRAPASDISTHLRRTISYFATKLKNESVDNREMGLNLIIQIANGKLFSEFASPFAICWAESNSTPVDDAMQIHSTECPVDVRTETEQQNILEILLTMLTDALEVQDLDEAETGVGEGSSAAMEHPVLSVFWKLSTLALTIGAIVDATGANGRQLVSFAFEIQWRIWMFRAGETGAAERFRLDIGERLKSCEVFTKLEGKMPGLQSLENSFVAELVEQHRTRIAPINPEYMTKDMTALLSNAYLSLGSHSCRNVVLQEYLQTICQKLEAAEFVAESTTAVDAFRLEYNILDVHDRLRSGSGVYAPLLQPDGTPTTTGGCIVYSSHPYIYEDGNSIDIQRRQTSPRYLYYDAVGGMWCVSDLLQTPANMSRVLAWCKSSASTPAECEGDWFITTRAIHRSHQATLNALKFVQDKAAAKSIAPQPIDLSWDAVALQITKVSSFDVDQAFDFELSCILQAVAIDTRLPTDLRTIRCILAFLHVYQHRQFACAVKRSTFTHTVQVILQIWRLILARPEEYRSWQSNTELETSQLWLTITDVLVAIASALPLSSPSNVSEGDELASQIVSSVIPLPGSDNTPLAYTIHQHPNMQLRYSHAQSEAARGNDEGSYQPYVTQRYPVLEKLLTALVEQLCAYDLSIPFTLSTTAITSPLRFIALVFINMSVFWIHQPALVKFAETTIDHIVRYAPRDSQGLIALEEAEVSTKPQLSFQQPTATYLAVGIFQNTMKVLSPVAPGARRRANEQKWKPLWDQVPLCNKYVDMMLHSREARLVLFPWLHLNCAFARTRAEYQQSRDRCFGYLLDCSKSAVHLRMIQRHIVRFRPEWLELLDSSTPILGPFFRSRYLGNELTRLTSRGAAVASIRGAANVRGRRPAAPVKAVAPPADVMGYSPPKATIRGGVAEDAAQGAGTTLLKQRPLTLWEEAMCMNKFQEVKKAKMKDAEWEAVDEDGELQPSQSFDYIDLCEFNLCYSLQHLSVKQCQWIGRQYIARAMNKDRPMPERVKAIILWTLLPSTDFVDVATFYENNKKIGTNLVEALLKGIMKNDEALAPLFYLLRPEFLGSNTARIATFALGVAVPLLDSQQMLQLIRVILSGDRLRALKVTTYKELIRLLATEPNKPKINLILREWKREQLHRDVRIVILQSMLRYLQDDTANEFLINAAWEILISCATSPTTATQTEVLTVLLAVGPPPTTDSGNYEFCKSELNVATNSYFDPRIRAHFTELPSVTLPPSHCEKYAKQVILPLCERMFGLPSADADSAQQQQRTTVTVDDDLAFMGLICLQAWARYGVSSETFALYKAFLSDTRANNLRNENAVLSTNFFHRFRLAADKLVAHLWEDVQPQNGEFAVATFEVIRSLTDHFHALNKLGIESEMVAERHAVSNRLEYMHMKVCELYDLWHTQNNILKFPLETYLRCANLAEAANMYRTSVTLRLACLSVLTAGDIQATLIRTAELYVLQRTNAERVAVKNSWECAVVNLTVSKRIQLTRACIGWLIAGLSSFDQMVLKTSPVHTLSAVLELILSTDVHSIDHGPANYVGLIKAVLLRATVDHKQINDQEANWTLEQTKSAFTIIGNDLTAYDQFDRSRSKQLYSQHVKTILSELLSLNPLRDANDLNDPELCAAFGYFVLLVYQLEQKHKLWGSNAPDMLVSLTRVAVAYVERVQASGRAPTVSVDAIGACLVSCLKSAHHTTPENSEVREAFADVGRFCTTTKSPSTDHLLEMLIKSTDFMLVCSLPTEWDHVVFRLIESLSFKVSAQLTKSPQSLRFLLPRLVQKDSDLALRVFAAARQNASDLTCRHTPQNRVNPRNSGAARVASVITSVLERGIQAAPLAIQYRTTGTGSSDIIADARALASLHLAIGVISQISGCEMLHWAVGAQQACQLFLALAPLACVEQCVEHYTSLFFKLASAVQSRRDVEDVTKLDRQGIESILSIGMVETAQIGYDPAQLYGLQPAPALGTLPAELNELYVAHYRRLMLQYCLSNFVVRIRLAAPALLNAMLHELLLPLPASPTTTRFDVVFDPPCQDGVATPNSIAKSIFDLIANCRATAKTSVNAASTSDILVEDEIIDQIILAQVDQAARHPLYDESVPLEGLTTTPSFYISGEGELRWASSATTHTLTAGYKLLLSILKAEPFVLLSALRKANREAVMGLLLKLLCVSGGAVTAAATTVAQIRKLLDLNQSAGTLAPLIADFVEWLFSSVFSMLPDVSFALASPAGELLSCMLKSLEHMSLLLDASSSSVKLGKRNRSQEAAPIVIDQGNVLRLLRFIGVIADSHDCTSEHVASAIQLSMQYVETVKAPQPPRSSKKQNKNQPRHLHADTIEVAREALRLIFSPMDRSANASWYRLRTLHDAFVAVFTHFPTLTQDIPLLLHMLSASAFVHTVDPFITLASPINLCALAAEVCTNLSKSENATELEAQGKTREFVAGLMNSISDLVSSSRNESPEYVSRICSYALMTIRRLRSFVSMKEEPAASPRKRDDASVEMDVVAETTGEETKMELETAEDEKSSTSAVLKTIWTPEALRCLNTVRELVEPLANEHIPCAAIVLQLLLFLVVDHEMFAVFPPHIQVAYETRVASF